MANFQILKTKTTQASDGITHVLQDNHEVDKATEIDMILNYVNRLKTVPQINLAQEPIAIIFDIAGIQRLLALAPDNIAVFFGIEQAGSTLKNTVTLMAMKNGAFQKEPGSSSF